MESKTTKNKLICYLFIALISLLVFQQIASRAGSSIAQLFNYSTIDPDNIFAFVSVHHIVQMLIAFIAIYVVHKVMNLKFNLKCIFSKSGIKYTVISTGVILIYVLATYIIGYKVNSISAYEYPLNVTNILGTLGFQLMLSGPSEEILFRALPITILLHIWNRNEGKGTFVPIIFTSLLFSIAHISWTLFPFSVTMDWFQLAYSFILGLAYGIVYIKSKSILYPMIMHSVSNVLMVGIGYLFMIVYS